MLHGIVLRSKGPSGGQVNEPGVSNNLIGGTLAGTGNLVEFNGTAGVAVFGNPISLSGQQNTGDAILGNSIFQNGLSNPSFFPGIDLSTQFPYPKDDGVTGNTPGGPHVGPNDLQNFPALISAVPSGNGTTIAGTLNSTPSTTFEIELFASSSGSDTGFGEGQSLVGFINLTTDGSGNARFSTTVPPAIPAGQFVSATATDPGNNTSEFSQHVQVFNPVPTITGLSPDAAVEGSNTGGLGITINGANFTVTSAVQANGTVLGGSLVTSTQMNVIIPGSLLADEGLVITVVNPAPGGGTSNVGTFTVQEALLLNGVRSTANMRFVSELYHDLLGRPVDASGLGAWSAMLDQGTSRIQVVSAIEASQEYRTDEVQALYNQYLHRPVDPTGLSADTAFLAAGGTLEQVATILVSSPEYFQNRGGGTNDDFVTALYQDALHRAADASGRDIFDTALRIGYTRAQVATVIFSSSEYLNDLVQSYYSRFLDRMADSGGLGAFTTALQQGTPDEVVIAAIIASDEFFAKTPS